MNRKIILLPLSAALLFGLASCGDNPTSTTVEPTPDTSTVEEYDGGVSELDPDLGSCAVSGIVAQIGTSGWTLDDGKAAAYVYGTIGSSFKVGDHVTVTGEVTGYYGLYEIKGATVNLAEGEGPVLADPVELTAADVNAVLEFCGKAKTDATWHPTNSKRYKLTNVTAVDVAGYPGWELEGIEAQGDVTPKLASYYYDASKNATEANQGTNLYTGCTYDVSFYLCGTSLKKNVNLCIFDATSHFAEVESITLDPTEASIEVGTTTKLTATVLPVGAEPAVTWTSSDEAVATVKSGTVTGVAEGTATITATAVGGKTATATITVTPATTAVELPEGGITLTADGIFNEDASRKSSYGEAFTSTVNGIDLTIGVNKNVCWNTYGDNKVHVIQIKAKSGAAIRTVDRIKSAKTLTIELLTKYSTQALNYLPTLTIGENTISPSNEVNGKGKIVGTATGVMNGEDEIHSYTLTYSLASVDKEFITINSADGACYIESITIA